MEESGTTQQQIPAEVAKLLNLFIAKLARENTNSAYANNTKFESSVWDLKISFGQLQQGENVEINWHTVVTIPWAQAKILDYYLRLNVAYQERLNGTIDVPTGVIPILEPPPDEIMKSDPNAKKIFEEYTKIHREIFGS
jgi:hypothetical protein